MSRWYAEQKRLVCESKRERESERAFFFVLNSSSLFFLVN